MPISPLELATHGTEAVVTVHGDLDIAYSVDVLAVVSAAFSQRSLTALTIDLADVEFCDSCGLGALIRVRNLCRDHAVDFRLANVQPRVVKVFTLTGLTDVFTLT